MGRRRLKRTIRGDRSDPVGDFNFPDKVAMSKSAAWDMVTRARISRGANSGGSSRGEGPLGSGGTHGDGGAAATDEEANVTANFDEVADALHDLHGPSDGTGGDLDLSGLSGRDLMKKSKLSDTNDLTASEFFQQATSRAKLLALQSEQPERDDQTVGGEGGEMELLKSWAVKSKGEVDARKKASDDVADGAIAENNGGATEAGPARCLHVSAEEGDENRPPRLRFSRAAASSTPSPSVHALTGINEPLTPSPSPGMPMVRRSRLSDAVGLRKFTASIRKSKAAERRGVRKRLEDARRSVTGEGVITTAGRADGEAFNVGEEEEANRAPLRRATKGIAQRAVPADPVDPGDDTVDREFIAALFTAEGGGGDSTVGSEQHTLDSSTDRASGLGSMKDQEDTTGRMFSGGDDTVDRQFMAGLFGGGIDESPQADGDETAEILPSLTRRAKRSLAPGATVVAWTESASPPCDEVDSDIDTGKRANGKNVGGLSGDNMPVVAEEAHTADSDLDEGGAGEAKGENSGEDGNGSGSESGRGRGDDESNGESNGKIDGDGYDSKAGGSGGHNRTANLSNIATLLEEAEFSSQVASERGSKRGSKHSSRRGNSRRSSVAPMVMGGASLAPPLAKAVENEDDKGDISFLRDEDVDQSEIVTLQNSENIQRRTRSGGRGRQGSIGGRHATPPPTLKPLAETSIDDESGLTKDNSSEKRFDTMDNDTGELSEASSLWQAKSADNSSIDNSTGMKMNHTSRASLGSLFNGLLNGGEVGGDDVGKGQGARKGQITELPIYPTSPPSLKRLSFPPKWRVNVAANVVVNIAVDVATAVGAPLLQW